MEQHLGRPSNSPEEPDRRNEVRVTCKNPEFQRLFNLANDLAMAMNPQRWVNLANPESADFMTEEERLTIIDEIKLQLTDALSEVENKQKLAKEMKELNLPKAVLDFIEGMDFSPLDENY